MNLNELKFLYDIVKSKYEYSDELLFGMHRSNFDIPSKDFYASYYLNVENRKINTNIKGKYYDLASDEILSTYKNYDLFCINTGGGKEYTEEDRQKARNVMSTIFPEKTQYES